MERQQHDDDIDDVDLCQLEGAAAARVNAEEKTGAAAMEGIEELAAGSGMNKP